MKSMIAWSLLSAVLVTLPMSVNAKPSVSKLLIAIEKNGMPILRSVDLRVFKLDGSQQKQVYSSKHHTAVIPLPSGLYKAIANDQGKTISKDINLRNFEEQYITLEF